MLPTDLPAQAPASLIGIGTAVPRCGKRAAYRHGLRKLISAMPMLGPQLFNQQPARQLKTSKLLACSHNPTPRGSARIATKRDSSTTANNVRVRVSQNRWSANQYEASRADAQVIETFPANCGTGRQRSKRTRLSKWIPRSFGV